MIKILNFLLLLACTIGLVLSIYAGRLEHWLSGAVSIKVIIAGLWFIVSLGFSLFGLFKKGES